MTDEAAALAERVVEACDACIEIEGRLGDMAPDDPAIMDTLRASVEASKALRRLYGQWLLMTEPEPLHEARH